MVEEIQIINSAISANFHMRQIAGSNYILKSCDWGAIESTHTTSKNYQQVGQNLVYASLETRKVEIVGYVVADNELQLQNLKNPLSAAINPQQNLELRYKSYSLMFTPSNTVYFGTSYADHNDILCKFMIQGVAYNPLFRDTVGTLVGSKPVTDRFILPVGWTSIGRPVGYLNKVTSFRVYNSSAIACGIDILLASAGEVVNPKVINLTEGKFIGINKTLIAGESVSINTAAGERKIWGTSTEGIVSNYYKHRMLGNEWIAFLPGDNVISIAADSGVDNMSIEMSYAKQYIEVL